MTPEQEVDLEFEFETLLDDCGYPTDRAMQPALPVSRARLTSIVVLLADRIIKRAERGEYKRKETAPAIHIKTRTREIEVSHVTD